MVAYSSSRRRVPASAGKETGNGLGSGERAGKGKKDVFRRNELSYLLQTQDLAFSRAKNELVFECKRTQNQPQIGAKNRLFRGSEAEFAS